MDEARGRTALVVVDMQPDFMPGGALPVAGGDALVPAVNRFVAEGGHALVVATQDWHPADHVSFASQHPGRAPFDSIALYGREQTLWPDHCVQGSAGAALHAGLDVRPFAAVFRKGASREVDSYSAFRNNWDPRGERPPTGLAGYLRERGCAAVEIVGLARDYCVLWSAEDSADAGFATTVVWDLTRPVDPASDERVRAALSARGVLVR